MDNRYKTIINKDLREILRNRQVVLPMIILPVILMTLLPAGLMIGAAYIPEESNELDAFMKQLPAEMAMLPQKDLMIELAVGYILPVFFLLIPIMASSIIGASSFVTEKENLTLETLLYTPVSTADIFRAKVTGTFFLAYAISLVSFILLAIVINAGGLWHYGTLIFPDFRWLLILLWLSPAVTLLGLTVVVMVSAKAKSFQEAQQKTGLLVIPFVLVVAGQAGGVFLLNNLALFLAGCVVLVVSILLLRNAFRKFSTERMLDSLQP